MMYYLVHGGGRGATLSDWDIDTIQLGQPTNNTPPYAYDRMIDVLTSSPMPTNVPGVNSLEIRGYDLDGASLSVVLTNQSSFNGTWSLHGNSVLYIPKALFSDSPRQDPAGVSSYDWAYIYISDGTNLSPAMRLRVLSYNLDWPNIDGLPDSWANTNGVSGATNDPDGDGMSNLAEWMNDTDPMDPGSALRITNISVTSLQWTARPYELYELWSSTNLGSGFSLCGNPTTPTVTNATTSLTTVSAPVRFYRIVKTP